MMSIDLEFMANVWRSNKGTFDVVTQQANIPHIGLIAYTKTIIGQVLLSSMQGTVMQKLTEDNSQMLLCIQQLENELANLKRKH